MAKEVRNNFGSNGVKRGNSNSGSGRSGRSRRSHHNCAGASDQNSSSSIESNQSEHKAFIQQQQKHQLNGSQSSPIMPPVGIVRTPSGKYRSTSSMQLGPTKQLIITDPYGPMSDHPSQQFLQQQQGQQYHLAAVDSGRSMGSSQAINIASVGTRGSSGTLNRQYQCAYHQADRNLV